MTTTKPILKLNGAKVEAFCQVCGERITADGHIWVNLRIVAQVEEVWEAKKDKTRWSLDELAKMPDTAAWQAHHLACDPEPDANAYEIPIGRIGTAAKLIGWTAHLMEKSWLSATDWDHVLREAGDANA
ncbi:hypothetical protein [Amycolatopsis sp. NPDC051061]|uniref:hypothetical protein n=1 Tax=Amycolatopsis sp. NPDC051061 TaxID=3155042 RepID=UPI00343A0AE9